MKHAPSFAVAVAACALLASTLIAAAPFEQAAAQPPPPAAAPAADDPGTPLFVQMCSKCHDAARITAMRRTKTEWEEVLQKMIERGATGSEKDFETVYDYVVRNFGKLNINVATPEDIVLVLSLSQKEAQGIVDYRKANGPFADFDAVRKVPDIDLKKLDDHRDAVLF
jgi:DNA uptake protein ComE-like DNA-binding protein